MKSATKPIWHCPPHLWYVATLPWEIKSQMFCRYWRKSTHIAFLIASAFVIHPQTVIFSVFKIANLSKYWLQIKFSMSLFFYLFTFAINLWHQTSLLCLSTINMILSNEDTILIKICIWRGTQWRGWQTNFPRKAGQSVVLISCSKKCGTQAQLTGGQPTADRTASALKKTLRSSAVCHWLRSADCQVKWPKTPFLSVKKTNSVAYCGNFWSSSLARFMRAAQFASVISCAQHLLKHFKCRSLQVIWDTNDWWMPVSRDISRTVLWVCGLSSWLLLNSVIVTENRMFCYLLTACKRLQISW